MVSLQALRKHLDSYLHFDKKLDVAKIDPYMTNGLMVRGKEEVQIIGFGVSASLSLFKKAHEASCDALIVHHSFNFPPYNHYDSIFQNRISYLIKQDISLFGYHFLLDAHPVVGNNSSIIRTIELQPTKPFIFHDAPWGWYGEGKLPLEKIITRLKPWLSQRMVVYDFGPTLIQKVVVCSGKGAPSPSQMSDLIAEKVDLYITGEVHEWNRELFREAGINLIGGGHYATEVFGVKALMGKIKNHFPDVVVQWIELKNEI